VRQAALAALSWQGTVTGSTASGLRRKRIHFLYLHSVLPEQEGGFRSLIEALSGQHRFVSYSEAVQRLVQGEIDAPYVSFSFDDGLASCVRAAEILGEYGASAAFFVCPDLVDGGSLEEVRRRLHVPESAYAEGVMGWDQIEALKSQGHEIGSHTRSHVNLGEATEGEMDDEIGGSLGLLEARLGDVRHFAWPFGRFSHFNSLAARKVFEAGFETCASAERGCHVEGSSGNLEELCLRRENVEPSRSLAEHLYFMGRSSRRSRAATNRWPAEWERSA